MTPRITFAAAALCLSALSGCQLIKGKEDGMSINATPNKTEAQYHESANKAMQRERFDTAEQDLIELRTFFPTGEHAQNALLKLIYIDYRQGDFAEAIRSADRFLSLYPQSDNADYAQYLKALSSMQSGVGSLMRYTKLNLAERDVSHLKAAFQEFQTLSQRYPNSSYLPDAAARMHYIYNALAEHEMAAARWYVRREAWVAALERAHWVFQYYPQSQSVPEAMATLAVANQKLGIEDTAQEYRQLIQTNYPALIEDGEVKIENARTQPSVLNRATLGMFGTPKTPVIFPTPRGEGQRQTLSQPVGMVEQSASRSSQAAPVISLPTENLQLGLSLPEDNPAANLADPDNSEPNN